MPSGIRLSYGPVGLAGEAHSFKYGLESEYLLAEADTFRPLWHRELKFEVLNRTLERAVGTGSSAGFYAKPPHKPDTPFIVEGYPVHDDCEEVVDILPKGVEIRTPLTSSLDTCLESFTRLHARMQSALSELGLVAVALSHHPTETSFIPPPGKQPSEHGEWTREAMLTYGPDVNISLPTALAETLDIDDLAAKVNHYAPALTALSLASPLQGGKLWTHRGRVGKAARTYRRSVVAPPFLYYPEQGGRLEFKAFEMSTRLEDFHAFFLLWLELLLDPELEGRASAQARVYDMGAIALSGLDAEDIRPRALEVVTRALKVLPIWGFETDPLLEMFSRASTGRVPADTIIADFRRHGSLAAILAARTRLERVTKAQTEREIAAAG